MTSYADAVRSNVPLSHPRAHISYETNKRDSESYKRDSESYKRDSESYQPKQRTNQNDSNKDDQYEETSSFNEYYDDDGNIKKRFIPKEHSEKIKMEAKQKKDEKQRLEAEYRRQRNDNYYNNRAPPRGDTDDEWKSIRDFLLSKSAPGINERIKELNEKIEGDFRTERKTVDEKINLIWEEKDDPVKKRTKDLEKKKKFDQNNNIPGYNKEFKKKPKKDNKEDEDAKPKIKTREVKGEDGFFYKKKVEVIEDKETGKLVDKDLPTVVKEETQEIKKKDKPSKEQRSAQFQNNMYEVTRYEGSFETKEA
jgi:hypothetical protein